MQQGRCARSNNSVIFSGKLIGKSYYKHKAFKLEDCGFPETELLCREVCSLPMNVEIDDEQIDYVIKVVKSFYK